MQATQEPRSWWSTPCGHFSPGPVADKQDLQCQVVTTGSKPHSWGRWGDGSRRGELVLFSLKHNELSSPLLWEGGLLPEKSPGMQGMFWSLQPGPQDRSALEAQGGGGTFPGIISGPLGHRGAHARHHLLALGSGLKFLGAFPGSQSGSHGAPAGLVLS